MYYVDTGMFLDQHSSCCTVSGRDVITTNYYLYVTALEAAGGEGGNEPVWTMGAELGYLFTCTNTNADMLLYIMYPETHSVIGSR